MIRILVISPNQMLNTLLTRVLDAEADFTVVGAITSFDEAPSFAEQIDIVGVHVDTAGGDLFHAIRDLRSNLPNARLVVLHTPHLQDLILSYIEAGASGYVREDQSVSQMLNVIRTVHRHGAAIDPGLTATLVRRVGELHREIHDRAQLDRSFEAELTDREWEVLECISDGCTNAEIGDRLFISTGTVKNHVHSILSKLDVNDRNQAAYWYAWRTRHEGAPGDARDRRASAPIAPDGHRGSLAAAAGVPEIRRMIEHALARFCAQLGWQIGHVFLLDEPENILLPTGIWHPAETSEFGEFRNATESIRIPLGDTIGQVLLNTEPTWIVDVREYAGFARAQAARADGIGSGLFLPLLDSGVIGVLEFYATERDEPDPEIVAGIIRSSQEVGSTIRGAAGVEVEEAGPDGR